ncbi:unnamed protein product [Urochloa decumbens]|uniref:NB-ARC domain-containing protein n=1 Tax=Urochloa decumbens TaxID=240449 RepID=A0ABC9AZF0_9POAL
MEFATGALGTLLPKLGQLLQDEYNLQKGAKKDIEFLSMELESSRAALRKVAATCPQSSSTSRSGSGHAKRGRCPMTWRTSSTASSCASRALSAPAKAAFRPAKIRHDIGKGIKDIKERVNEVAERRDRYKVEATAAKTFDDPRITYLYTEVADLIAVDDSREELIMRLAKGEDTSGQQLRIASVVGIEGLGKTRLAKVVYFIVIDDVWEIDSWKRIKSALIENNIGSRIIIATRDYEVARKAGCVYELQPLSYDNSRKLFFGRIFGGESKHGNDQQDDEVSDKILRKCGGIPLAIIAMASVLLDKPREEWSEVHHSIDFGQIQDNHEVENTMKIISFSYYELPPHLRACLLYISVFPEDHFIEKTPLIWMWIAEDFIKEEQGTSSFEIGEGYFNKLVDRSMITLLYLVVEFMIWYWTSSVPFRMRRTSSLDYRMAIKQGHLHHQDQDKAKFAEAWSRHINELGGLRELRVLRVTMCMPSLEHAQVHMVQSLCNLHKLEHLSLSVWPPIDACTEMWQEAEGGSLLLRRRLRQLFLSRITFSRFPSFFLDASRLPVPSHLSLGVHHLDAQDLRILGKLPELRYLKLHVESTVQLVCTGANDACLFRKLRWCILYYSDGVRLLSSGISIRTGRLEGSMLLGSGRNKNVAPTLLPSVKELKFWMHVQDFKDSNGSLSLEYFASLHSVSIRIVCRGASAAEAEQLEASLRRAADVHPNRPALEVKRSGEYEK